MAVKNEIPLLIGSPKDKAIINPHDFISYKKNIRKDDYQPPPKNCIITFDPDFLEISQSKYKSEKISWLSKRVNFCSVLYNKRKTGLIYCGIGGTASGTYLEELIATGVENIITIGSAGSIQEKIQPGELVIITKALRDEGISYHYKKPSKYSFPNNQMNDKIINHLKKNKIKFHKGATWTTDAVYRETLYKTKKYQKEGVLTVDMEAAGLFAIAEYRKVKISSIFWISDTLHNNKWSPYFETKEIKDKREIILDVALNVLNKL